jgi:putative tricarboxylic transport membrane protein
MANRIFAGAILLIALGYTVIAFTLIHAPFQYDPLGPEAWPRLVGSVTVICAAALLVRPDDTRFDLPRATFARLVLLVGMLLAYAALFQPLGFIVSTTLFCGAMAVMLGARLHVAVIFAVATGVLGYLVCARLLELNLPAGVLAPIL